MLHHRSLLASVLVLVVLLSGVHDSHAQQALTGTTVTNINAHATPNTNGQIRFSLPTGLTVTIEARNGDSQWLLIRTPNSQRGWVRSRQIQASAGIEGLPVSAESIGQAAVVPDSTSKQSTGQVVPSLPVAAASRLARTPPMGWNSWNYFHCGIDETLIKSMADQMIALGLKAAGYNYVIVDDCWQGRRDDKGFLTADPQHFPSGMKALAAYVHDRGLKFGIYSSRGATSCAGLPGSLGFESKDATAFADWGVDYVKYDGCPYDVSPEEANRRYQTMAQALRATGRPILFSIVGGGYTDGYSAMAQLNRTTGDMQDNWDVMLTRFDGNASFAGAAHPGFWNDPDALEVGNGKMSMDEYQTHFSLWAISAAPLIISADLRTLDPQALKILTNPEVVAVDQDALGVQGYKVSEPGAGVQVWVKRLQGRGNWAAVLVNRTQTSATIPIQWRVLSPTITRANVRDLWTHADLGNFEDGYSVQVQPHNVAFIKISSSS